MSEGELAASIRTIFQCPVFDGFEMFGFAMTIEVFLVAECFVALAGGTFEGRVVFLAVLAVGSSSVLVQPLAPEFVLLT